MNKNTVTIARLFINKKTNFTQIGFSFILLKRGFSEIDPFDSVILDCDTPPTKTGLKHALVSKNFMNEDLQNNNRHKFFGNVIHTDGSQLNLESVSSFASIARKVEKSNNILISNSDEPLSVDDILLDALLKIRVDGVWFESYSKKAYNREFTTYDLCQLSSLLRNAMAWNQ
ncbi:hypothetical protein [Photobacterium kishitanii]|uniref:Uncharacterized protein n=1 Tax=Photobacterium kishitanii TaxID=318456 RepID=A0A2T3KL85_9GAMM|nr:hypothetical protein [Photobacterium kishitanii]PSV00451.1 hypothetical protein C9J27_04785 [Photobacterium kishitanii]